MFELFSFIEKNKTKIVEMLVDRIPKDVPIYLKVPKGELKTSMEHLLEAFGDFLATNNAEAIYSVLKYIAKVRAQQSFKMSDVLRALLVVPQVIRILVMQEHQESAPDKNLFDAIEKIETVGYNAAALFADIFQEYLVNLMNEHKDYLQKTNQKYGIDLSKYIIFKG